MCRNRRSHCPCGRPTSGHGRPVAGSAARASITRLPPRAAITAGLRLHRRPPSACGQPTWDGSARVAVTAHRSIAAASPLEHDDATDRRTKLLKLQHDPQPGRHRQQCSGQQHQDRGRERIIRGLPPGRGLDQFTSPSAPLRVHVTRRAVLGDQQQATCQRFCNREGRRGPDAAVRGRRRLGFWRYDQYSVRTSRRVRPTYSVRIRPRRCSAGTSPSVTSTMNRRLVRWKGCADQEPVAADRLHRLAHPLRHRVGGADEIHLGPRSTEPLHGKLAQRFSGAPLGEFVERPLFAVGGQPLATAGRGRTSRSRCR